MKSNIFYSPFFKSIKSEIVNLYTSKKILKVTDSLVVFVCGAVHKDKMSARDKLMKYAKQNFNKGNLFQAEDIFSGLVQHKDTDLLTLEHFLAKYSDCILIINESAGTLTELGAFATNEEVVKKLFLINPKDHFGEDSFINNGPIAKINKKSKFKKTIYIDMKLIPTHFDIILKRIEERIGRKYRNKIDFSTKEGWKSNKEESNKLKLLLIQDIINIFSPLNYNELEEIVKYILPYEPTFEIELELLKVIGMVTQKSNFILTNEDCKHHNYDVDKTLWLKIRKKILDLYRELDYERITLLKNHIQESV